MQSPLSMHELAQVREAAGPSPLRTMSMTPPITSTGLAAASPAGGTLGHASTHLPQRVQASSISSTRAPNAVSNGRVTLPAPRHAPLRRASAYPVSEPQSHAP